MMKNKKNLLIILLIVGLVLIGVGYYVLFHPKKLPLKEKVEVIKPVVINNSFVAKVGDSLLVSDGKKYGYYDFNGKKVIDLNYKFNNEDYSSKLDARDNLYVVTGDGNSYGVVDNASKEIIPKMYKSIKIGSKNCFVVQDSNSVWYVIDSNNNKILDTSYTSVEFVDGFGFILKRDIGYNFIDLNGKKLSDVDYATFSNYFTSNISVPVVVGQKDGVLGIFILRDGKIEKIDNANLPIFINEKDIYYATNDDSISSCNIKTGKIKNNVQMSNAVYGMIMTINDKELAGYESEDGKTVIPAKYDYRYANQFTKYGLAVVREGTLFGIIDKKGNEVLPIKYDQVSILSDKLFGVHDDSNELIYLINDKKEKLFDAVVYKENIDNLLVVYKDKKCGIISNYGDTLFDVNYSYCEIYDGTAIVRDTNNQWNILRVE